MSARCTSASAAIWQWNVIDFEGPIGDQAIQAGRKKPLAFMEAGGVLGERLISRRDTPDFAVNRYRLQTGALKLEGKPGVYVVTSGAGTLACGKTERTVEKGGYFFSPELPRRPPSGPPWVSRSLNAFPRRGRETIATQERDAPQSQDTLAVWHAIIP